MSHIHSIFNSLPRNSLRYPLFPYTTLFRSLGRRAVDGWVPCRYRECIERDGEPCNDRCSMGPLTQDRKSTRLNSSHGSISYAVFCLKKKICINDTVLMFKHTSDVLQCI